MFDVYKVSKGTVTRQPEQFANIDRARDAIRTLSRLGDDAFYVERSGTNRPLVMAYGGMLYTSVRDMLQAITAPPVERVELIPPPQEVDDDPPPKPKRTRKPRATKAGPEETKARGQAAQREHKAFAGTVTDIDEESGIVRAIVSVFGIVDDGDDVIHPGAFAKTLAENFGRVRVLNSHNGWSVLDVLGKPLAAREIGRADLPAKILAQYPDATGGLETTTQYLLTTPEGRGAFERIKSGAVAEYSIGFDTMQSDNSIKQDGDGEGRTVRNIRQVRLWEYSPVVWGMNPATATVSVKNADPTPDEGKTITIATDDLQRLIEAFGVISHTLADAGIELDTGITGGAKSDAANQVSDTDGAADEAAETEQADDTETGPQAIPVDAPTSDEAGPQGENDAPDRHAQLLAELEQRLATEE